MTATDPHSTHEVLNQSPPFEDVNIYTSDVALGEAVAREGGDYAVNDLTAYGAIAGSAQALELSRLANENSPKLKPFDIKGHRLDTVEFHPAWHDIMHISMTAGVHCLTWEHLRNGGDAQPGRHVARAGLVYMQQQLEPGHSCPTTMTNAVVPALLKQPELAKEWLPRLTVRDYDPSFKPASQKRACTLGMGMTEKQGGTDVRANSTVAEPLKGGGPGTAYALTGHKWFMSAPMCDGFLMLAQAPGGLSCFLVPRFKPDGSVNELQFQRLKDKLGNRSNASSEVEFHGCHGQLVGEEGRGVPTIIDMITYTRLDCAVASAGLMRQALANAAHHARYRTVFQKKLIDQPLMRQVLSDLALDVEAAVGLVFRLARAFDRADGDESEAAFARVMTPVIKYWVCKAVPPFVCEAMECMGGNGYVEEGVLARLYREAPLNAIWEGSGNVMCLDVLRVLHKEPHSLQAVHADLADLVDGDPRLKSALDDIATHIAEPSGLEANARQVVERLALVTAAGLLRHNAPQPIADAFIASRFGGGWRYTYGMLDGADHDAVLDRV